MPLSIFSPIIYLLFGLILGKFPIELKGRISMLLTKVVIPLVIIYNIATHQSGAFAIMLGIIIMMFLMLGLSRMVTGDKRPRAKPMLFLFKHRLARFADC